MTDVTPRELSFQEKVALFSADYLKCCKYLMQVEPGRDTFTKRLYSLLISSSQLLEDLLDFHGAKNNRGLVLLQRVVSNCQASFLCGLFSKAHL